MHLTNVFVAIMAAVAITTVRAVAINKPHDEAVSENRVPDLEIMDDGDCSNLLNVQTYKFGLIPECWSRGARSSELNRVSRALVHA
jgi:hypothetical protein